MADHRCNQKPGKAEDFSTDSDSMDLTNSDQTFDQNRRKRDVLPSKKRRADAEYEEPHCPHHNLPMEFYCKTCRIQVCNKCLLEDHDLEVHKIVKASNMVANLLDQLQTLNAKQQRLETDRQDFHDKISTARQCCQKEAHRLKNVTGAILQREIQQLQRAANEMFNVIDKKAAEREQAYTGLQKQYSDLKTCSNEIHTKCTSLSQQFQHKDLSLVGEVEQVYEGLEYLQNCMDSLQITFQSTPNNMGLSIDESPQTKLGIKLSIKN